MSMRDPAAFVAALASNLKATAMAHEDDWAVGYRAAVRDMQHMAKARGIVTPAWEDLFFDMEHDAHVIGHEMSAKARRKSLGAVREAMTELPLPEPPAPRAYLVRPT